MKSYHRRDVLGVAAGTVACLALPRIGRAATRHFRIAHNNTLTSVLQAGAVSFATAMATWSEGRFAVDVFPNAHLGNEAQITTALAEGSLDAAISNVGTATAYVKDITLVEMPYLFRDTAAARAAFDGALGGYVAERLKPSGILVAGWGELGLRHITANKPIRAPVDLKGLKIRVQLSEPTIQTFNTMGAAAEPLPFPQLTEALRTGRFEAQENPITIVLTANLNQVQTHMSLTGHVYSPSGILLSNDVFEELTQGDRDIVMKAGAIAAKAMRDFCDASDKDGLGKLKAIGMTVVEDVDRAAFRDASAAAHDKLAQVFGADSVKRIKSFAA